MKFTAAFGVPSLVAAVVLGGFLAPLRSGAAEETRTTRHGTVSANVLNVRARPGQQYEVIGKFKKDDPVQIVGEAEGWYEVLVPTTAEAWIAARFINAEAKISVDRVKIHSGPGAVFSTYGFVGKDVVVKRQGEPTADGWQKIEAPADAAAWVGRDYVVLAGETGAAAAPKTGEAGPAAAPTTATGAATATATPATPEVKPAAAADQTEAATAAGADEAAPAAEAKPTAETKPAGEPKPAATPVPAVVEAAAAPAPVAAAKPPALEIKPRLTVMGAPAVAAPPPPVFAPPTVAAPALAATPEPSAAKPRGPVISDTLAGLPPIGAGPKSGNVAHPEPVAVPTNANAVITNGAVVTREGLVTALKEQSSTAATHLLSRRLNNTLYPDCYLISRKLSLKDWEQRNVRVFGREVWYPNWKRPVLEVTGIQNLEP